MTLLVPPARPNDHDLEELRSRLSEVEAVYGERSAAAARAEAELAAFKIRYRQEVGLLHDELDRLIPCKWASRSGYRIGLTRGACISRRRVQSVLARAVSSRERNDLQFG